MSSVQEIEQAIIHLSPQELEELLAWVDDRYAQAVDVQLAHAVDEGVFDDEIRQALANLKAGATRAL